MKVPAGVTAAAETVKEQIAPGFEAVESVVREGRRAFDRGRQTAEDAAAAAAREIQRRPFGTVGAAVCAAAVTGAVIGFVWGRFTRDRAFR